MSGSLIASYARTPIGKLSGALASLSAADLGGAAIAGALARAGIEPEQVDHVIMGHVSRPGRARTPPARPRPRAGSRWPSRPSP